MERKFEQELETLVHRELKRLPLRPAPATLAPRVLAAIQARTAPVPAWKRPIWTLPRRTQWLITLLFLSVFATAYSWLLASPSFAECLDIWTQLAALGQTLQECGETLLSVAAASVQSLSQFWLMVFVTMGLAAYLFCLATGSLFYSVAIKRN